MNSAESAERISKADKALIGQVIDDRFRIEEILGFGGMSVVYRATHTILSKSVTVKVLQSRLEARSTALARFQREIETTGALNHPNVVQTFGAGIVEDDRPYLVLEYLQGQTLAERLASQGPLPWREALPIFVQILEGLKCAHEHGIVHRDIKPSNIMLLNDEGSVAKVRVKLLDFGVAGLLMPQADGDQKLTTTAAGVPGSPPYMSPEACNGKKVDERSDIYSFGCLAYETLSGTPPFTGDSALEIMMKQTQEAVPPFPKDIRIPEALRSVIWQTLEKQPERRPESCARLLHELDLCENAPLVPALIPAFQLKLLGSRTALLAITSLICLLIVGASFLARYDYPFERIEAEVLPTLTPHDLVSLADRCYARGDSEAAAYLYSKATALLNNNPSPELITDDCFRAWLKTGDALFSAGQFSAAQEQYVDLFKRNIATYFRYMNEEPPRLPEMNKMAPRFGDIYPRIDAERKLGNFGEGWYSQIFLLAGATVDPFPKMTLPMALELKRQLPTLGKHMKPKLHGDVLWRVARCYARYPVSNRYAHQKAYENYVQAMSCYETFENPGNASEVYMCMVTPANEAAKLGDTENYNYWLNHAQEWLRTHQVDVKSQVGYWRYLSDGSPFISAEEGLRTASVGISLCRKTLATCKLSDREKGNIKQQLADMCYRAGAIYQNKTKPDAAAPLFQEALNNCTLVPSSTRVLSNVCLARLYHDRGQADLARIYFDSARNEARSMPNWERLKLDLKPIADLLGVDV